MYSFEFEFVTSNVYCFVSHLYPYRRCGSIAPVYIVLRAACWSPQLSLADLDCENINFVQFSAMYFMCSLKVSLWSNIMPKYFMLRTCNSGLLFRYILTCSFSFLSPCHEHNLWLLFVELEFVFSCPIWNFAQLNIHYVLSLWDGFRCCHETRSSAKVMILLWWLYCMCIVFMCVCVCMYADVCMYECKYM